MTPTQAEGLCINVGDPVVIALGSGAHLFGEYLGHTDDEETGIRSYIIQREGYENPSRVNSNHVAVLEKAAS